jgi:hypothetical protein
MARSGWMAGWMIGRRLRSAYTRASVYPGYSHNNHFMKLFLNGHVKHRSKTSQYNNISAPAIRQELPFPANYLTPVQPGPIRKIMLGEHVVIMRQTISQLYITQINQR